MFPRVESFGIFLFLFLLESRAALVDTERFKSRKIAIYNLAPGFLGIPVVLAKKSVQVSQTKFGHTSFQRVNEFCF